MLKISKRLRKDRGRLMEGHPQQAIRHSGVFRDDAIQTGPYHMLTVALRESPSAPKDDAGAVSINPKYATASE